MAHFAELNSSNEVLRVIVVSNTDVDANGGDLHADAEKIVKINSIICSNVDGTNSATLNLYVDGMGSGASGVTTTGADATIYLAKTMAVPADATLVILNTPIYLMEADVLKGGASATSDLTCTISYEILDDA